MRVDGSALRFFGLGGRHKAARGQTAPDEARRGCVLPGGNVSEHETIARRGRGGIRLPRHVGGLIDAMRAVVTRGDSRPLEVWDRQRFPVLRGAIEAWTGDALLADRLASRIVKAAWDAVKKGRDPKIRAENAWMTVVARRTRTKIRRDDRPIGSPLPPDLRAPAPDPLDELIRREDHGRVRRAIALLPGRHGFAVTLRYLHEFAEAEVAAVFERSFGIRLEGTRQILKNAREMVKTALEGRDPRVEYPNRYAREKKSLKNSPPKYTPPAPFEALHR